MPTAEDMMWQLCMEHREYGRHHESQRQAVTTLALAATSALIGFVVSDGRINFADFPIGLLVTIIGIFGAVLSMKHYERFSHHYERYRALRDEFQRRIPNLQIASVEAEGDKKNRILFPRLSRMSLGRFWLAIHLILTTLGVMLAVAALLCMKSGCVIGVVKGG